MKSTEYDRNKYILNARFKTLTELGGGGDFIEQLF